MISGFLKILSRMPRRFIFSNGAEDGYRRGILIGNENLGNCKPDENKVGAKNTLCHDAALIAFMTGEFCDHETDQAGKGDAADSIENQPGPNGSAEIRVVDRAEHIDGQKEIEYDFVEAKNVFLFNHMKALGDVAGSHIEK